MAQQRRMYTHPELGDIYVDEKRATLDYYLTLLRLVFGHFTDKSINTEQVSVAATIIKELVMTNEVFQNHPEELAKVVRVANSIAGLSSIESDKRLEKNIERIRKYIYD